MKTISKDGRIEYVAPEPVMDRGVLRAVIDSHEWPGIVVGSEGIDGMQTSYNRGVTKCLYPSDSVPRRVETREILAGRGGSIGDFFGELAPKIGSDEQFDTDNG